MTTSAEHTEAIHRHRKAEFWRGVRLGLFAGVYLGLAAFVIWRAV